VNELKNSFKDTDLRIFELNLNLALRAKQTEVNALAKKVDDLENRSRRNNIIIQGVKNHMGLDNKIKIRRAHRTKGKRNTGPETAS